MNQEQFEENAKRMEEILKNNINMEKVTWRVNSMTSKAKSNKCILCKKRAGGLGMFLLHKSLNKEFNLKEESERLYFYYVCSEHGDEIEFSDRNILLSVEESLKTDNGVSSFYLDIEQ